jgi:hypothetical protein
MKLIFFPLAFLVCACSYLPWVEKEAQELYDYETGTASIPSIPHNAPVGAIQGANVGLKP